MLRKMKKLLSQSTLEYAVLIVIVAGALMATQIYIKRGYQGRLKSSADDLGDQFTLFGNVVTMVNATSRSLETVKSGVTTSNLQSPDITTRTVNTQLDRANVEYWGA